jgi:uncharacterized protein (DUF983 family)
MTGAPHAPPARADGMDTGAHISRGTHMNCERCGNGTTTHQMSFFNTQMCCHACIEQERAHPKYAEARAAEKMALEAGDRNFNGIGLPNDLC